MDNLSDTQEPVNERYFITVLKNSRILNNKVIKSGYIVIRYRDISQYCSNTTENFNDYNLIYKNHRVITKLFGSYQQRCDIGFNNYNDLSYLYMDYITIPKDTIIYFSNNHIKYTTRFNNSISKILKTINLNFEKKIQKLSNFTNEEVKLIFNDLLNINRDYNYNVNIFNTLNNYEFNNDINLNINNFNKFTICSINDEIVHYYQNIGFCLTNNKLENFINRTFNDIQNYKNSNETNNNIKYYSICSNININSYNISSFDKLNYYIFSNNIIKKFKFKFNFIHNYLTIDVYLLNDTYETLLLGEIPITYEWIKILFYLPDYGNLNKPLKITNEREITEVFKEVCNSNLRTTFSSKNKHQSKYEKMIENISIKPFEYQKNNILWMNQIEHDVDKKLMEFKFIDNPDYKLLRLDDVDYAVIKSSFNSNNMIIKKRHFVQKNYLKPYVLNGGILADDVGLGKTLCCICHIVYCLENDIENASNYMGNNLIILPPRLICQWELEFKKYVKKEVLDKLNICKIVSVKDVKKIVNKDIKKHNVFIISYNILTNTNYCKYLEEDNITNNALPFENRKFDIVNTKWNRIFIDEGHEIMKFNIEYDNQLCKIDNFEYNNYNFKYNLITNNINKNIRDIGLKIVDIQSNYKWIISATPFELPLFNLYAYTILFNMLRRGDYKKVLFGLNNNTITKVINRITRKTTKTQIRNQVSVPIFTEEIKYLNQTTVERNMYMSAIHNDNTNRIFQLCTHLLVSDDNEDIIDNTGRFMTLKEINEKMIGQSKKLHKTTLLKLKENDKRIIPLNDKFNCIEFVNNYLKENYKYSNQNSEYFIPKLLKDNIDKEFNYIDNYSSNQYHLMFLYSYSNDIKLLNDIITNSYNIILSKIQNGEEITYQFDNELFILIVNEIKDILTKIRLFKGGFNHNSGRNLNIEITPNIERNSSIYYYNKKNKNLKEQIRSKINTITENNKKLKSDISRLENQIRLFESDDFMKESVKDPCPICLTEYTGGIAISICRHILCSDCVKELFRGGKTTINCAFCRKQLKKDDYNMTTIDCINDADNLNDEARANEEQDKDKPQEESKIEKYGTKLAYLIDYLQELFANTDSRVIIFSQYDKMLRLIGIVLKDFNIKHIYIKGNVYVVNKNITKFKTDNSIRVVMLSSETCASGNNLTEASHIIFADVLNANKTRTRDIESQAIGRAIRLGQNKPVVIKRLIMNNTIEEDYFKTNRYDMRELQFGDV